MSTITLNSADHAAVNSAAKILLARYRGFVEFSDVQQELYVWLLSHYDRPTRWREEHSVRHAERTLIKALRNVGEKYCRTQKSEYEGYQPDDEFFYSLSMCADLLQLYFDPEWAPTTDSGPWSNGPSSPSGADDESRLPIRSTLKSGKPASEGGNLLAMVADIGRAFKSLPEPDRALLRHVYGDGDGVVRDRFAELSLVWDCSYSAAQSRVRRVLGRLRAALGGPNPYGQSE